MMLGDIFVCINNEYEYFDFTIDRKYVVVDDVWDKSLTIRDNYDYPFDLVKIIKSKNFVTLKEYRKIKLDLIYDSR